jgi:hypothetical protein
VIVNESGRSLSGDRTPTLPASLLTTTAPSTSSTRSVAAFEFTVWGWPSGSVKVACAVLLIAVFAGTPAPQAGSANDAASARQMPSADRPRRVGNAMSRGSVPFGPELERILV